MLATTFVHDASNYSLLIWKLNLNKRKPDVDLVFRFSQFPSRYFKKCPRKNKKLAEHGQRSCMWWHIRKNIYFELKGSAFRESIEGNSEMFGRKNVSFSWTEKEIIWKHSIAYELIWWFCEAFFYFGEFHRFCLFRLLFKFKLNEKKIWGWFESFVKRKHIFSVFKFKCIPFFSHSFFFSDTFTGFNSIEPITR